MARQKLRDLRNYAVNIQVGDKVFVHTSIIERDQGFHSTVSRIKNNRAWVYDGANEFEVIFSHREGRGYIYGPSKPSIFNHSYALLNPEQPFLPGEGKLG